MANYALEADIERLLKSMEFTETSKITSADLTAILTEKTAYIDSRIAGKYETPATDTTLLAVLKIICKLLAGAEVLRTAKESIGMDVDEKDIVSKWEKRAKGMLDEIVNGELTFPNATKSYPSNLRQTGVTDDAGEDIEPKITMETEF